jgi:hypothetical protein
MKELINRIQSYLLQPINNAAAAASGGVIVDT